MIVACAERSRRNALFLVNFREISLGRLEDGFRVVFLIAVLSFLLIFYMCCMRRLNLTKCCFARDFSLDFRDCSRYNLQLISFLGFFLMCCEETSDLVPFLSFLMIFYMLFEDDIHLLVPFPSFFGEFLCTI